MGVDFIDYIITDRIVAPIDHEPYYTEKLVHLPDSYQVNDSQVDHRVPKTDSRCVWAGGKGIRVLLFQ